MEEDASDSVEFESEISEVSDVDEFQPILIDESSVLRDLMNQGESTSDVESSACSNEGTAEILPDPDEETRTLPSEHQVTYINHDLFIFDRK